MKDKYYILFSCFFVLQVSSAQSNSGIKGKILDAQNQLPIMDAVISVEGLFIESISDDKGEFILNEIPSGDYLLTLAHPSYQLKTLSIIKIPGRTLDLGIIYLQNDLLLQQTNQIINLTSDDLLEEGGSDGNYALLQANRDIFLTRAAFDFSQAFFRLRGYDWKEGKVAINGIEMNKVFNGRAQWNNWGGLNDVTRNQDYTLGLSASAMGFGGVLGFTNINMRPSSFRPGFRVSSSFSNRTYTGRVMATYSSGASPKGFSYSTSASRRWAKEGYIDGTLYDSYAAFLAFEYKITRQSAVVFTGILSSNRRGQSAPVTREVFNILGRKYNSNWGIQNDKIRNARSRIIREPIAMLNYYLDKQKLKVNLGFAYQFGQFGRNRVSYFGAPNPDPVYYRYLPSYYINQRTPNFENANLAREALIEDPQINWTSLYLANQANSLEGGTAYLVQQDRTDDRQLSFNALANCHLNNQFKLDAGLTYRKLVTTNYARINDLLGASFHEDIDTFTDTQNDMKGDLIKKEGAIFAYNYEIQAAVLNAFTQLQFTSNKYDAFVSGSWESAAYDREGLFLNERFPENSLGKSETAAFSGFGLKGGATYRWNERHIFSVNASYQQRAPNLQNVFINPRENNEIVPDIQTEQLHALEFNYFMRWKDIKGRITSYYTDIQNITDINFFYVESGVGNDFVQEVTTGAGHRYKGVEIGMEYQVSSDVKLTAAVGIGDQTYSNNANLTINFDTSGEDVISTQGKLDLGTARIRNYKLANGPQTALAIGLEYRSPKYWWMGITANYLDRSFTDISKIKRTSSFLIDPETNAPFPEATNEAVSKLLKQEQLEAIYLLNLVGGKSWLVKNTYISAFVSVNNLFDLTFRTGGFEQSRNGNFGRQKQDISRGNPSFGPKHWYGFGRTFFLNLAVNF
ncbi:carboxypeptidase-like regulatory domain-containing protein [Flavobacteriaceae bacterium M23B6Z8]